MSILSRNERGFTMVEVILATFLLVVGVVAMMQIIPVGWFNVVGADYKTRAASLLQRELDATQALIMNPCNSVSATSGTKTVYSSGQAAAVTGDIAFSVSKTITSDSTGWLVTVTVSRDNTLLAASRKVIRQGAYSFPDGCSPGSVTVNLINAGG